MPTFYRIVKTNPPTVEDFLSYKALGVPLRRDTPELRRSWDGVSVYDNVVRARDLATAFPRHGQYVAELEIEASGPVHFEQTSRDPRHYDLWAEPGDMLERVGRVFPV